MPKKFKASIHQKLMLLILIFLISLAAIILTDYLICQYYICDDAFSSIGSSVSGMIGRKQGIGLLIKSGIGLLGAAVFLLVSKQMAAIISGRERIQETLKEQNLKIIRKSIELSDVMRQFEDQNYDLQISRKELNEALSIVKEKERHQRIIFDNSPLGIIRFNSKGEIKECNDKFVELMGSSKEQLIGFNTAGESTPEMQKVIKKALNGKEAIFEDEYTSVTGGKTLDLRVMFNPVNPGTSPTQVIATLEDITERKRAEKQLHQSHSELEAIVKAKTSELIKEIEERKSAHNALKKSEEKYRSILESIEDSYFEVDLKGRLTFFNTSLSEALRYPKEELKNLSYKDYTEEEEIEKLFGKFQTVYATGETSQLIHCTFITKDKERKDMGLITSLIRNKNGEPIGFQGLARDMTRQKIMENKLKQTQKMEAIGNLASGVAHDFNNILGGIIGYTQLIRKHSPRKSKVHPYIDQVMKASERASGLVKQILLFTRQTESEKIPSDMGLIAKEVIKLLRASIPTTIEIKSHFKEDLHPVLADQTQLHQVFMNLCANAADAMKEGGGCLELRLTNVMVSKETETALEDLLPGEYIHLSISDTGKGMSKKVLERIFDPYFTTKAVGSGTGLGLSTVHGIVKDHEGVIHVQSKPGVGTVFDIYFPAIQHIIEERTEPVEIAKGSEAVLFVDDEAYLSEVGKEMLEDYGYDVESTTSSLYAYELFEKDPAKFDLVITDYTMPEMTGETLSKKIRKLRPDIPIIMCTGISLDKDILENLKLDRILMKPIDMDDMLKIVRDVLDKKST